MTTTPTSVTDAEAIAFLSLFGDGSHSADEVEDTRRALEQFVQSRQPSSDLTGAERQSWELHVEQAEIIKTLLDSEAPWTNGNLQRRIAQLLHRLGSQPSSEAVEEMRARKDAAYLERNQVVAALAKCFPSGVAKTAIEGWSEDWHGCVYIDLPIGQVSWHFHDSQAYLFEGLPQYAGAWDGHDTPEKYQRLAALPVGSEAVEWSKPRELHIDAFGRGYPKTHAHIEGATIKIEATDGNDVWFSSIPAPWTIAALKAAHPQPAASAGPLTTKEIADLTAMVWGAPVAGDDLKKAEIFIRAYEAILKTGERPVDPVNGGRFIDVPGAFGDGS